MRRVVILALIWLAAGACVAAPALPALRLPPGSSAHGLPAGVLLNQASAAIRVLDIALPMAQAAQMMAGQFEPPLSVLPHGNELILAASPASPWRLILSPRGNRTFGVLSALSWARGGAGSVQLDSRPSWLPHGLALRFGFQSHDHGSLATQQVFTHPRLAPADLAKRVHAGLARNGWKPAAMSGSSASAWSRGPLQLMVSVVAAGSGSGLFVLYTEPAMPAGATRAGVQHD